MLTPREEALLHNKTVRELRTEIMLLEKELSECHNAKRKHWLEVRLSNVMEILRQKLDYVI
jgi:hypothetical protein